MVNCSRLPLLAVLTIFSNSISSSGRNGGNDCTTCTLVTALVSQYSQKLNIPGSEGFKEFCNLMPSPVPAACKAFLKDLKEEFDLDKITELASSCSPDDACEAIGMCRQDLKPDGENLWPKCHLYPATTNCEAKKAWFLTHHGSSITAKDVKKLCRKSRKHKLFCKIYENTLGNLFFSKRRDFKQNKFDREFIEREISKQKIEKKKKKIKPGKLGVEAQYPASDADKDGFGTSATVRGWHWNGYDCNDKRNDENAVNVYPGRSPELNGWDGVYDSNCNGISGNNDTTGIPFEQELCEDTPGRGVLILGDSASAHFHIPMNYVTPETWDEDTFRDLLTIVGNEGDFPMTSWGTGIDNVSPKWTPNFQQIDSYPNTNSIYNRMRDHNRCNHNDYQNNGVNGGATDSMTWPERGIMYGMVRNTTNDLPMVVFLALIGNDVCTGHEDSLNRMTTPEDFYDRTLVTLNYLDEKLPKGSAVFISGLADGRLLYAQMHNKIHPLGQFKQNVRFKDFYDFMDCLEVSPCRGWLQTNATLRDLHSERARELSQSAKAVVRDYPIWDNFKTGYYDFDLAKMGEMWLSRGGKSMQDIIDPFDGFHPSQVGMSMQAEYMWEELLEGKDDIIGARNPNNEKIDALFGNFQFHGDGKG